MEDHRPPQKKNTEARGLQLHRSVDEVIDLDLLLSVTLPEVQVARNPPGMEGKHGKRGKKHGKNHV